MHSSAGAKVMFVWREELSHAPLECLGDWVLCEVHLTAAGDYALPLDVAISSLLAWQRRTL